MAVKCPKCHFANTADSKFCKECGTQLISLEGPQVSKTLTIEARTEELVRGTVFAGRYEIIEELGAGGMGKVYRAHDTKLNEEVALKLIKPEIAAEGHAVERFRNELKVARKIRHKNVCGMYDLHEEGRTLYLTMEYVRGEDLKSLLHRTKALTVGVAISVAHQIAEGLAEAHKLGITHRDLKPGNVMIDKEGNAKIMDFGIARTLVGGGTTVEGTIVGTPEYMSPEQVEGKPADGRADIYALGVILFEMLTGRVPFEGETPFSIANKHKSEPPPIPKKLVPQIPDELNKLILRCLEKDRDKRYQSAEDLLADLSAIEGALPTAERAPFLRLFTGRRPAPSKTITVKITPRKVILPVAAFLVLLAASLIVLRQTSRGPALAYPTDRPSLAILYFQNNTGDTSLDHWSTGLSDLLIYKLSLSRFLWVLPKDRLLSVLNLTGLQDARSYSAEDVKKLASRQIGRYLLSGSFFKSGEIFQVHTTIQDGRSGKVVDVLSEECQGEAGLMGLVDNLSPRIKGALEVSEAKIAADIDRSVGEITTSSPEALRLFSEGTGSYVKGNYSQAIDLLKKAVELDPDFAMAHRQLSALYGNRRQYVESTEHLQKAIALKDRVSERERLIIEGQDFLKGQGENLVAVATRLLERWPEDILGNRLLLKAYEALDDQESAFKYAERGFRFYPESAVECANLADCYQRRGEFDKAEKILLAYSRDFPDSYIIHRYLGWHFSLTSQFDRALEEIDTAQRLEPGTDRSSVKGLIIFAKGDLAAYSGLADERLASQNPQVRLAARNMRNWMRWVQGKHTEVKNSWRQILNWEPGEEWEKLVKANFPDVHLNLASLCLSTGDFKGALEESHEFFRLAGEAKDRDAQMWALVFKGRALLRLKDLDGARKTADELLLTLKDAKGKHAIKIHHLLDGLIELESRNPKKAVEKLEKAESLLLGNYGESWNLTVLENARYLDALAQAYYRSGKLGPAKARYEKIASTGLFRFEPDIWVKSFYWLGRIAEDRGKKAEARGHYEKFLDLWKDADPELPEVEDARKRLAVPREVS